MPEGDTVFKIGAALRPELEGATIERLWTREQGALSALHGRVLDEVATLGKHLLVTVPPSAVLHVHLGIRGRWERVARGLPPEAPAPGTSLLIATGSSAFAVRHAKIAVVRRRTEAVRHPSLARLGPDLLAPDLDLDRVVERALRAARPDLTVADLLLDQTVACGLGNVYKSELSFLCGLAPSTPSTTIGAERLAALYTLGRRWLLANLGGWRRTTVVDRSAGAALPPGAPRLWVYGRAGEPCLECRRATITCERTGDDARTTYWCPRCQPGP